MSFRKRNVVIGSPVATTARADNEQLPAGTRPSPLDGRPTTSTGTSSLDQLLAGHAGLAMGSSLLVEESGTTDFGGILLRYYAAEGLVQGHHVHVLGVGDAWRRDLPGLSSEVKSKTSKSETPEDDKMKIAWRYEAFGNKPRPSREVQSIFSSSGQTPAIFCHSYDLSKRLENSAVKGELHTTATTDLFSQSAKSHFSQFLAQIYTDISRSPSSTIHRIIVPSLLSPTVFASSSCRPENVLQFLHGLRALLRRRPRQVTAIVTIPISLYPRATGLTRWIELRCDGVIEFTPLEHQSQIGVEPGKEDKPQGLLRCHSLPVFHEKGGGMEGSWAREDLSFKLSSSNGLVITPFHLPPVGEDEEDKKRTTAKSTEDKKKESLDF